jgi:DNA-binding XRE family transcriptional regulator
MNKQTAVEWLEKELNWIEENKYTSYIELKIQQAKALEEQRQLDLIKFLRTQDKMGKSVEDLYEQFKSEQNESI